MLPPKIPPMCSRTYLVDEIFLSSLNTTDFEHLQGCDARKFIFAYMYVRIFAHFSTCGEVGIILNS